MSKSSLAMSKSTNSVETEYPPNLRPKMADVQKLARNVEVNKLSQDQIPTKSKAQDGRPVKGKDYILPTA